MRGIAVVLAVTMALGALAGCAPDEVGSAPEATATPEATGTPEPGSSQPSDLDQAYLDAAAFGATYEPPFDVYYPAFVPEGFALTEAKWIRPGKVPKGESAGLYVTYERGTDRIGVGVAVGDIGEAEPVAALPWGSSGEVSVYPDAWEDSYIAIHPSASEFTPVVRTIDVTLGELTALLGSMTQVEP